MGADHEFTGALDRLIEHDYVRLVRAVALFSGRMDGAEDAVQEALARALESARKGRHIYALEAWVVTAAFNHVRSASGAPPPGARRTTGPTPCCPLALRPTRSVRSCTTSGRRSARCRRDNAKRSSCTTTWTNPSVR
jgi:hypothetical protein